MFGKSARSAGDTPARKTPRPASLLAGDLVVNGQLTSEGDLHIDGAVRGDVKAVRVTLGETGRIEGDIQAEAVEVRGQIQGSIQAAQVRVMAGGRVDGDITHDQLIIEAGGHFQGRSVKLQAAASPDLIMIAGAAR